MRDQLDVAIHGRRDREYDARLGHAPSVTVDLFAPARRTIDAEAHRSDDGLEIGGFLLGREPWSRAA